MNNSPTEIANHQGIKRNVTLNDNQRLRHYHIIGATGTGKSTLITNLFLEDVKHGNTYVCLIHKH